MTNALIVYASLTGNTEEAAEIYGEALKNQGFDVMVKPVEAAEVDDFLDYDLCIVGSYTYGPGSKGQLPSEIQEFYDDLSTLDLTGHYYTVFGSGDDFYPEWCTAVDDFDHQFKRTGAVLGAPTYKFNLNPEDQEIEDLYERSKQLADAIIKRE